jgi:hypothetical protein
MSLRMAARSEVESSTHRRPAEAIAVCIFDAMGGMGSSSAAPGSILGYWGLKSPAVREALGAAVAAGGTAARLLSAWATCASEGGLAAVG